MSTTFRATVVTAPGGSEPIQVVDVPVVPLAAGEVRVAVEAATVNPVDPTVASGFFHEIGVITQAERTGLGWDFAGVVTGAGAGVDIPVGTRVAGIVPGFDRDFGSYAEEIVADRAWVAVVPDRLTAAQATTLPLNALTASQLVDLLGEGGGRRLLVTGAAGAVGSYVVRLAAERGWDVTGLARRSDEAFVRGLGADFAAEESADWDAVADPAALQEAGVALVRDGGTFVGVLPSALPGADRGVTVHAVSVEPDAARLDELLQSAARGDLPTEVAAELPLDDVVDALRLVAKGGFRGRYVLRP